MRLFVYGTLQPQAGTRMGQWIADRLAASQEARAVGTIHAVHGGNGWFPALVQGGGAVRGIVCDLRLKPGERALLDRYEGAEYRRICLPVRTVQGTRSAVQAYVWRISLPAGAIRIASGDYLDWLARTGRRSFTTPRYGA